MTNKYSDLLEQDWRDLIIGGFDLETTGTSWEEDRIIEFGIARYKDAEFIDQESLFINPGVEISEEITRITKITNEDVADAPRFADVSEHIVKRLQAQVLLAYNKDFDLNFIKHELQRLGVEAELPPTIDPLPFAFVYLRMPGRTKDARLGTVCEFFNIPLENAHRAGEDAQAAVQVLYALADFIDLPTKLGDLLNLQQSLDAEREVGFTRFRGGANIQDKLDPSLHPFTLGQAWLSGEEPDPIKSIFRTLP